jgi:ribose 5-phosphate isomerase B
MKIAIGADHKGFELKEKIKALLKSWGHDVVDFGTDSTESVDYSDYGVQVGKAVAEEKADRGIAICWTGNGMTIAANKIDGVRATIALSPDMARLARAHNDSNVLTLASKYLDESKLQDILKEWLDTKFDGGRHVKRLAKIPHSGITESVKEG